MADPRVQECMYQHERMVSERQTLEKVWQQIEERINPSDIQFGQNQPREKGKQNNEKVFDATPGLALDRFKAAIHSLVTPRNQMWHNLKAVDEELAEDPEVQRYLDEVKRRLFASRYAVNFDTEVQACYYNAGKFGSMAMFIGDRVGRSLYYRAIPMKQLYFAENEFGEVDMLHRDWHWTARQAYRKWGDKLPRVVREAAEKRPQQMFRFLHVVKPRTDADVSRRDYRGMPFLSYYILYNTQEMIEEGGFRAFPYAVGRYDLNAGEVYGRSPCMTILPDVKMLNEMNRTTIQAAQLMVLPPLLAAKDGVLDAIRITPGAVNRGALEDNGRQLIQPMTIGGDVRLGLEMMDQKRSVINDALLQTLFQILVDKPNITATEAMLRAQEKGQLIGPTGARIESEFLNSVIMRELDILAMNGQLPEMPEQLMERGGLYEIEYDSPLSRARESEGGVAVLRTFEQLAPLAQVDPTAFKRFNSDAISKELARLNGMPAKLLYTDEEMEEIDAATAQQNQVQQLLAAAPVAAGAAKDIAQAQSLAAANPNQALPNIIPE